MYLRGGSTQEGWYLFWHPFPEQHLKYRSTLINKSNW